MTVAELIKALQSMPQDMPVVARGYEDGWDDVDGAYVISVKWEENWKNGKKETWWSGKHGDADKYDENTTEVVAL